MPDLLGLRNGVFFSPQKRIFSVLFTCCKRIALPEDNFPLFILMVADSTNEQWVSRFSVHSSVSVRDVKSSLCGYRANSSEHSTRLRPVSTGSCYSSKYPPPSPFNTASTPFNVFRSTRFSNLEVCRYLLLRFF